MNKKMWIGVGVAAVIIIAAVWFFFFRGNSPVVATVNGTNITAYDIEPWIGEAKLDLEREWREMFPGESIDYEREFRDGLTFEEVVRQEAVRIVAINKLFATEARRLNIRLGRDDFDRTNDQIAGFRGQMNTPENPRAFNEWLTEMGFRNERHLANALDEMQLAQRVAQAIIESPEESAAFLNYVDVLGAKHILIGFDQHPNEDEAREIATALWERALAGENFDMLVAEYGQDPGMQANPQGYTFGPNQMVPEFEQGTRDLEIGGISEPIQSSFGFHIIQRIEPDPAQANVNPLAVRSGFETRLEEANLVFLPALNNVRVASEEADDDDFIFDIGDGDFDFGDFEFDEDGNMVIEIGGDD